MSLEFNWERMGGEISHLVQEQLQTALLDGLKQAAPADAYIKDLEVESFSLGDVPPYVEIISIEHGTSMGTTGKMTKNVEFGTMGPEPRKKAFEKNIKSRSTGDPIIQRPKDPPNSKDEDLLTPRNQPNEVSTADGMPWIRQAAEWIGPDGISTKIRFTYGGNFHCKVRCVLQYSAMLEDTLAIGLSLPVSCHLRNLKINCVILCNLKNTVFAISMEKRPTISPVVDSQLTPSPADISHMLRFDLLVTIGDPADKSTIPETQWDSIEEPPGFFTFLSFRSLYSAVRSILRNCWNADGLKSLYAQGMHGLQQLQEGLQRRVFQQVQSLSPVQKKSTSACVDERVITAFVRDRINFWLEENVVEPNFIRMAG